jgi:hypothetical protein
MEPSRCGWPTATSSGALRHRSPRRSLTGRGPRDPSLGRRRRRASAAPEGSTRATGPYATEGRAGPASPGCCWRDRRRRADRPGRPLGAESPTARRRPSALPRACHRRRPRSARCISRIAPSMVPSPPRAITPSTTSTKSLSGTRSTVSGRGAGRPRAPVPGGRSNLPPRRWSRSTSGRPSSGEAPGRWRPFEVDPSCPHGRRQPSRGQGLTAAGSGSSARSNNRSPHIRRKPPHEAPLGG